MIKLSIDGVEVTGREGQTIFEISEANNIHIPTLCHDERVQMYGSCGICVVEAEGNGKLLRSCSTLAADGMIIKTNSERIKSSRRTTLELLLSDHTGDCRPPCVLACPGQTDCQGYVGLIANGEYGEALRLIKDKIPLPASIGRVCPHPCETACRRQIAEQPIDIAHLKQFAADKFLFSDDFYETEISDSTGKSVAVIGGGPGGLACAYYLRKMGHEVTIYEAMPHMGGMLRYGIPEYRLPKSVLDREIELIQRLGIKFINNVRIGTDVSLSSLRTEFNAVVIAIGAWKSTALRCPGENLDGVIGGIEFLRDVDTNNQVFYGKKVAIVGGGNTAMDACRTAVRLGAENVYNIYRRTRAEMPANPAEIDEAIEEGVVFKNLTNPIEIIGDDGKVKYMRLQIMELGEPDASGRRLPVPVAGAEEMIEVDTVIVAIGQKADITGFEDVKLTRWGTVLADEASFLTNLEGVFAIGDATNNGADIAITAIGEAKHAAGIIDSYLIKGMLDLPPIPYLVKMTDNEIEERVVPKCNNTEKKSRVIMNILEPQERIRSFREVYAGMSDEDALREAERCLECGCPDYFECKLLCEANNYGVKPEKFCGEKHNTPLEDEHPFIKINHDKCILCGLCVRVCEEVMGVSAYGFVGRGFDTTVKPALCLPLTETECISCGQCAALCPTGAITDVTAAGKQTPVAEEVNHVPCSYCSLGCPVKVTSKGDTVLRCLPDETFDPKAILCSKGRFGIVVNSRRERIRKPLIRKDGVLVETDFDEAFAYIAEKTRGLQPIGVAVSDKLTNEYIDAVKKFTVEVLSSNDSLDKSSNEFSGESLNGTVFSFNARKSGMKSVLGSDCSTCGLDGLLDADLIFVAEDDIFESHTISAVKISQYIRNSENNAKLVTLNRSDTYLGECSTVNLRCGDNLKVLKQFLKALLDTGLSPQNTEGLEGFEELKAYLSETSVTEDCGAEIRRAAELFAGAEKAVIVFEQNAFTTDAAELIAAIYEISGGRVRDVIQLKPNVNSQGLINLGITPADGELLKNISSGTFKSLFIFGEDVPHVDLPDEMFTVVADYYLTETAKNADVVIPMANFFESGGSVTNTFGETRCFEKTIKPFCDNIDILIKLAGYMGKEFNYVSTDTNNAAPEKYTAPKLAIPKADVMYNPVPNTHTDFLHFAASKPWVGTTSPLDKS